MFKLKNKNDFFYLSEGTENCKISGSHRIWRWMISGNPAIIILIAHFVHISYIGMSFYGSVTHVLQFYLQLGFFLLWL